MSLAVNKLQEGGNVLDTFKYGELEANVSDILDIAELNLTRYLEYNNWNRKKLTKFLEAYSNIVQGIKDGTIRERDLNRNFIDTSGKIENKKHGWDPVNEVAIYLNQVLDVVSPIKPKEPEKYTNTILDTFNNRLFGGGFKGSDDDYQIWYDNDIKLENGKLDRTKRANIFADILDEYASNLSEDYDFTDTPYKDRADLIQRLSAAAASLRDNTFNNDDYASLVALGLSSSDIKKLFFEGEEATPTEIPTPSPAPTPTPTTTPDSAITEKKEVIKLSEPTIQTSNGLRVAIKPQGTLADVWNSASSSDKKRLTAVALDLTSAISAFIPGYGTITSGVTGLGGTTVSAIADVEDNDFSLGRTALNATLDLAGLVPGLGVTAKLKKVGSVLKGLSSFLVKAGPIMSAFSLSTNAPDSFAAILKIIKGEDVTVNELRSVANTLTAMAGLTRTTKLGPAARERAVVNKQVRKIYKGPDGKTYNTAEEFNAAASKKDTRWYQVKNYFKSLRGFKTEDVIDKSALPVSYRNAKPLTSKGMAVGRYRDVSSTNNPSPNKKPTPPSNNSTPKKPSSNAKVTKKTVDLQNMSKEEKIKKLDELMNKYGMLGKYDATKKTFTTDDTIYQFGEGGILKAYQGIKFAENAKNTWANDVFTKYKADLLKRIAEDPTFVEKLNNMLSQHSGLYNGANQSGDWETTAYSPTDSSVTDYQKLYQDLGYNDIAIAPNWKTRYIINGERTSHDSPYTWNTDNYYSAITDDRRILGRKGDFDENGELFQSFKKDLESLGYTLNLDSANNYYKISPINVTQPTDVTPDKSVEEYINEFNKTSTFSGNKKLNGYMKTLGDLAKNIKSTDLLAIERLRRNLKNNREVARTLENGLNASLLGSISKHRQIVNGLPILQYAEKLAALQERPSYLTSDVSTLLANAGELRFKANNIRLQGAEQSNKVIDDSREKAYAVQDEVYNYNRKVADENVARTNARIKALSDIKAGLLSSNQTNLDTFLQEIQYNLLNKQAKQEALDSNVIRYKYRTLYNNLLNRADIKALRVAYQQALADNKMQEASDINDQITEITNSESNRLYEQMQQELALAMGLKYNYQSPFVMYKGTETKKKGGKLNRDNELFLKGILNTIKNNQHTIDNLSRATLLAIKRALDL